MNTQPPSNDSPFTGDDPWIEAVLREHSRLGRNPDEAFLQRLDQALDAKSLPEANHRSLRWPIAIAASIALLLTGILWRNSDTGHESPVASTTSSELPTDGIDLFTTLPPELIEGTPKPMRVPSLVAAPTAAPTLRVPEGTVLLSKGKPVTSSDDFPIIGELSLITDGDKDAGEGYFVELLDGLQWVQIDLEQSSDLHAIWLWHYHSQRRAYHDVIIQVSDDPAFLNKVTTVFNNDYDNSAKMGKGADNPYVESRFGLLVNTKGAKGRYVRLYSQGNTSNDMNHYIEVEIFGITP